jgi:heavy metal sensor kinase
LPLRIYTQPLLVENAIVGYIQVADDQEEVQETIDQVRRSLTIGIPLALLISGLLSLMAARQALRPLIKMTRSAATISAEDLDKRLPVPQAKDEVQALALAFNATLDRLAAAFARQRRFTADASHELRTPVTAILGQAELALRRPRSPEAYQQSLTRIQSEAERMQRLIGRMLSLARLETGSQPLTFVPTDVAGLVHTLADTLQPRAVAKGLAFKINTPPILTLSTDADSLTQILLNLLENAITYTDQGSVELSLATAKDHICLKISDSGQGIPPEHLPHIFQPFYRADPARSQDQGRVGLGLALTYELVHLLGGTIEVASQPQLGTTFTLTLPTEQK